SNAMPTAGRRGPAACPGAARRVSSSGRAASAGACCACTPVGCPHHSNLGLTAATRAREGLPMAEYVPHPLVTRVGIGLTGQTWVTLPDDASGAAADLGAEVTPAADAAKLAAQNATAQAAWAAAVIVQQAAQEASAKADDAAKRASAPDAPEELVAQRADLEKAAKQAKAAARTAKRAADAAK